MIRLSLLSMPRIWARAAIALRRSPDRSGEPLTYAAQPYAHSCRKPLPINFVAAMNSTNSWPGFCSRAAAPCSYIGNSPPRPTKRT